MSNIAKNNNPKYTKPDLSLSKKVPRTGGINPETAFRKADKIIADLASEFHDKLDADIKALELLQRKYKEKPCDATIEPIFKLVHNLRGQGATFGFPLVTDIGSSFCRYLQKRDKSKPLMHGLLGKHLDALRAVYRESQNGKGDAISQAVVKALKMAVDHAIL
jgi:hypothetical protein